MDSRENTSLRQAADRGRGKKKEMGWEDEGKRNERREEKRGGWGAIFGISRDFMSARPSTGAQQSLLHPDHIALTQWNLQDIIQIPVLLPENLDPGPNITGVYSGLKHIFNPSFMKIHLVVFVLSGWETNKING